MSHRSASISLRATTALAFTLVELLVVIAIIALLMAILMPTLANARKAALQVKCQNHHRQLFMAMEMYIEDFRRYPGYQSDSKQYTYWFRHLSMHGSLPYKTLGGNNLVDVSETNEVFQCPSQPPQNGLASNVGYAIYRHLGNNVRVNVPYPDRTMLLIDRTRVDEGAASMGILHNIAIEIAYRHLNGTTIALYADGSQHLYTAPPDEPGGIPYKDFRKELMWSWLAGGPPK